MVLFVCTGNTCRSPMAEALARQLHPDWEVGSAGLAAQPGEPASEGALRVMAERGLDLSGHRSRPLDRELIGRAERILVMTEGHLEQLLRRYPEAAARAGRLRTGADVTDPFGGSLSDYRACAEQLSAALDPAGAAPQSSSG